jgi:hypothetical protein
MSGTPRIETCVHYASMRQIHAAIEHLHHGDFECAITLAAAGEGMLPATDKPHFLEKVKKLSNSIGPQEDGATRPNDITNWLKHAEADKNHYETATILQLEVIVIIYRAITKFEAIFEDQKTPQMLSFKNWAREHGPDLAVC